MAERARGTGGRRSNDDGDIPIRATFKSAGRTISTVFAGQPGDEKGYNAARLRAQAAHEGRLITIDGKRRAFFAENWRGNESIPTATLKTDKALGGFTVTAGSFMKAHPSTQNFSPQLAFTLASLGLAFVTAPAIAAGHLVESAPAATVTQSAAATFTPAAPGSFGGAPLFGAEHLAASGFETVSAASNAAHVGGVLSGPAAGTFGGPALFSSEHLVQEAVRSVYGLPVTPAGPFAPVGGGIELPNLPNVKDAVGTAAGAVKAAAGLAGAAKAVAGLAGAGQGGGPGGLLPPMLPPDGGFPFVPNAGSALGLALVVAGVGVALFAVMKLKK